MCEQKGSTYAQLWQGSHHVGTQITVHRTSFASPGDPQYTHYPSLLPIDLSITDLTEVGDAYIYLASVPVKDTLLLGQPFIRGPPGTQAVSLSRVFINRTVENRAHITSQKQVEFLCSK